MHYMAKDGAMPLDPPLDNPGLLDELHVAATIIQKRIRGVLGRKAARRLCEEIIVEEYEEFTRMERAATSVQATFRGHVVRKDVAKARGERYSAAVKLQTKYRGHKARKEFREMRRETVEAATTVQSRFRGFQARKGTSGGSRRERGDRGVRGGLHRAGRRGGGDGRTRSGRLRAGETRRGGTRKRLCEAVSRV